MSKQHDATKAAIRRRMEERHNAEQSRASWFPHDIVDFAIIDKPGEIYRLGCNAVPDEPKVWLRNPPMSIAGLLERSNQKHQSYWQWTSIPVPGQLLFVPNDNLQLVLDPGWQATGIVRIEIGCIHEMVVHKESNCYREMRCTKCGYHWGVDSSD